MWRVGGGGHRGRPYEPRPEVTRSSFRRGHLHLAACSASRHSFQTTTAALLLVATLLAGTPGIDPGAALEKAIQSERERLSLPPLRRDPALDVLASRLALRISEDGELDFDAPAPEELLALARESGYPALVVQALFAVDAADGCEIVAQWNRNLAPSEVYRRHEARDAGIGVGWLQDMTAYVLLVGVPPTPNPSRRRELGTAPREYPIADLVRLVNRRRGAVGLPELGRDPELDAVAQREAFRVLSESAATDETLGYRTEGGVTFVYARVANNLARDFRPSVDRWFQFYRDELLRRDAIACGAGIASREVGERLEAVLVLALSPK